MNMAILHTKPYINILHLNKYLKFYDVKIITCLKIQVSIYFLPDK